MSESDLIIVIPVFNKQDQIIETIERLIEFFATSNLKAKLLVVNDGSTDKTSESLKLIKSIDPSIVLIELGSNSGKGFALKNGFEAAMKLGSSSDRTILAFTDADLDLDPSALTKMIKSIKSGDCDVAIGSKYHPESSVNYPIARMILSQIYRLMTRASLNLNVSDSQVGLKCFRRDVIETCLPYLTLNGFAFDLEFLAIAKKFGFNISEFPINLNYSLGSTVGIANSIQAALDIFKIRKNLRKIE